MDHLKNSEKDSLKPISRKARMITSLVFLGLMIPIFIIWTIFFAPYYQLYESITALAIILLVLVGLAALPWLAVWFPRE